MASLASSGEVRRRKNPGKKPTPVSSPPAPADGPATLKKRRRPGSDAIDAATINATATKNGTSSNKEYDEYAWFVVFLSALTYFIATRGGNNSRGGVLSSFSKPYHVVSSSVAIGADRSKSAALLRSTFHIASSSKGDESLDLAPNHRLEAILSSPPDVFPSGECPNNINADQTSIPYLSHLSSTTWVHDEELGRGYLLLADAGRAGRIWRWEVGGGPITIGRSLHMERSGCRSGKWVAADKDSSEGGACPENLFADSAAMNKTKISCPESSSSTLPSKPPLLGSASLAVELTRNSERASAGKNIIVAEWGERRIVRVEGETGARTPLVTMVPNNQDEGRRRVFRPNHLTYTPFGDLLFSDNFEQYSQNSTSSHVGVVYRRKEAVHIPAIAAEMSREAHEWKEPQHNGTVEILFRTDGLIEGMALGTDFSTLYILVTKQSTSSGWTKLVYKLRLGADEDDEEDSRDPAEHASYDVTAFYEMRLEECKGDEGDAATTFSTVGSKLAVDDKGTIYLIACPSSVMLLSEDGEVAGTLASSNENSAAFTSVSFGEDGYLYITSASELLRVKSRVGGMGLPTNLVVPPPLKKE